MTRDGTPEPVSRDQILRRGREQVNINFLPCSDDHRQDWQLYLIDPYSAICDDRIHTQRRYAILYRECYQPILKRFVELPSSISRATPIDSDCCRLPTSVVGVIKVSGMA